MERGFRIVCLRGSQVEDANSQHAEVGSSCTPYRRRLFVYAFSDRNMKLDLGGCGGPGAVLARVVGAMGRYQ